VQLTERYANESDESWLWAIFQDLLKPSITAQWGWDEGFQQNLFKTDLPVQEFIIYSRFGVDVGASLVRTESDHYYVKMLLVVDEFQGMGIGRFIMQQLKSKADRNSKAIRLSVIKANDVAGFYEKLGFIRTGENDGSTKYQYAP
jgi:ribosomal protein S18 acetylase RimI-like enzyme